MGRAANRKWSKRAARYRGFVLTGKRDKAEAIEVRMRRRQARFARALSS